MRKRKTASPKATDAEVKYLDKDGEREKKRNSMQREKR